MQQRYTTISCLIIFDTNFHAIIGEFTTKIAEKYSVKSIIGIDIDSVLIQRADDRLVHLTQRILKTQYSISSFLPRALALKSDPKEEKKGTSYPNSIKFKCVNIMESDFGVVRELIEEPKDVVICLSVTKWVHLNSGDDALLSFFKRLWNLLLPGGLLILEYQAWASYVNNRKKSERIQAVFPLLKIRPENFEHILSVDMNFVVEVGEMCFIFTSNVMIKFIF